ncbi:MAG: hypothetical protein QXV17_14790 [Candidatus Micrarchaeaceae archaeon]
MITKEEIEAQLSQNEAYQHIRIDGLPPGLLMHNALSMLLPKSTKKGYCPHGNLITEKCDKCIEASAYRNSEGILILPSTAVMHSIVSAASAYDRVAKRSINQLISGTVRIVPYEIPLEKDGKYLREYDVHVTPVVVQRNRIIRMRPWVKEWEAEFYIIRDTSFIPDGKILVDILKDAGRRIGVLDFRPQRKGPFGTFTVEEIK